MVHDFMTVAPEQNLPDHDRTARLDAVEDAAQEAIILRQVADLPREARKVFPEEHAVLRQKA